MIVAAAVLLAAAAPAAATACPGAAGDAASLSRRGFEEYDRDRYAAARACFTKALARAEAAGQRGQEAEARRGLGRLLFREGRFDEAAAELDRALTLFEAEGDRLGAARVRNHLGSVSVQRRERERARELYAAALAVFEDLGATAAGDRAQVLYNQLFVAGDAAARERLVQEALPLARAAGDGVLEGRLLSAWGDLGTDAGDYAAAAERYGQARRAYEAAGARSALGRVLTSLGRLHMAHGDPRETLALAGRALRVQQAIGDVEGTVQTLNLLGTASTRLGRHPQAVTYFTRAQAAARARGDARLLKLLSVRLAEARLASGDAARAGALLEEALVPPVDPEVEPGAWELLARARLAQGQAEAAREAATRALDLARASRKPLFAALHTRALASRRLGRWEDAVRDAQEGVAQVEETRARLIPRDFLKQGFGERHQALYALAIDVLHRAGRVEEALEASEQGRARAFLDLLATREPPAGGAPALEVRAGDSPATAPPLKRAEVAAAAQRLGSHVVSYWVAEDATYVWVVAPGGDMHSARLAAGAARLRALVAASAAGPDVLRQGGVPDPRPWRALHRLLVEPIAQWLPRERGALLTLVPHGPLLRLSFAALRDARGGYLVERYSLHSVPAISALRFTARAPAAPPRYLLVGDPQALPPAPGGRALPRLAGAAREVNSLRRLLDGRALTVLTGAAAGEAAVKEALPAHTVAHLATHGVVRDDAPLSSFVALGAGGQGEDGRLTAAEVYGLRLDAPLVFLGACRTGRGPVTGDGLLGLTRAFLSAGAASLVATLWDVPDAPSAELVPAFYRALERGEGRARALRAAQLDLLRRLRGGTFKVAVSGGGTATALPEDPALWAGFTLLGEP